ncbi:MAG: lipid-A-disaccharide synthase [Candidatus Omnitrophica bacterium]|nr:lipid-A-disaccharide synthase [Candidatus Omnitrophota bacterium]
MSNRKVYVIAGEASGDLHGAHLIENLKQNSVSPLEIYGVGGDKIRSTGAKDFFDLAHFHVTGFTEALKKIPAYRRAAAEIIASIKKRRPGLVVLIDNPGFNLHLAEKIHTLGIPIVYYIAPQVWAWAPKRVLKIKKTVTKVLVVFEFEKKLYEDNDIPVAWVGHPLKDQIEVQKIQDIPLKKSRMTVALLPGSRKSEVERLLPIFLKAAQLISWQAPSAAFRLILSPTLPKEIYGPHLQRCGLAIERIEKDPYSAIAGSALAIVCSGTATLECALLGTPMVICNKSSFVTYVAAKSMIRVPFLGLPNLILGEKRFPELLQYDATPEKIAAETLRGKGRRQARGA